MTNSKTTNDKILIRNRCPYCCLRTSCKDKDSGGTHCLHSFIPSNNKEYINALMTFIKSKNIPAKENKLKRHCIRYNGINYEDFSLDKYYTSFINDVLKQLRLGKLEYLFSESQVAEIFRFEPLITVDYCNNIFYVKL